MLICINLICEAETAKELRTNFKKTVGEKTEKYAMYRMLSEHIEVFTCHFRVILVAWEMLCHVTYIYRVHYRGVCEVH